MWNHFQWWLTGNYIWILNRKNPFVIRWFNFTLTGRLSDSNRFVGAFRLFSSSTVWGENVQLLTVLPQPRWLCRPVRRPPRCQSPGCRNGTRRVFFFWGSLRLLLLFMALSWSCFSTGAARSHCRPLPSAGATYGGAWSRSEAIRCPHFWACNTPPPPSFKWFVWICQHTHSQHTKLCWFLPLSLP